MPRTFSYHLCAHVWAVWQNEPGSQHQAGMSLSQGCLLQAVGKSPSKPAWLGNQREGTLTVMPVNLLDALPAGSWEDGAATAEGPGQLRPWRGSQGLRPALFTNCWRKNFDILLTRCCSEAHQVNIIIKLGASWI